MATNLHIDNQIHILSEEQVGRLLDPAKTVAAIEEAFTRIYGTMIRMPTRMHVEIPPRGVMLIMPCYDPSLPALGVKVAAVFKRPDGSSRVQSTYLLFEPETGQLRALLAGNQLTDFRTAAASAVATKHLARAGARTLGIFGTGRQARAHIIVLRAVLHFERVLVCGSQVMRSQEFARQIREEQNVEVEAVNARTCVAEADLLCTCTTSKIPVFDGGLIRPGTHLNLVGTFQPYAREVDDETIRRARIVVDTYNGALSEAGDLLIPLQRGAISHAHIVADLHEILTGEKVGRRTADEITLFKSVGCALEDLATAQPVYEEALHQHILI